MLELFEGIVAESYVGVKKPSHIESRLTFAVAAKLFLYLEEVLPSLRRDDLNRGRPLLHCLVEHPSTNLYESYGATEKGHMPYGSTPT